MMLTPVCKAYKLWLQVIHRSLEHHDGLPQLLSEVTPWLCKNRSTARQLSSQRFCCVFTPLGSPINTALTVLLSREW